MLTRQHSRWICHILHQLPQRYTVCARNAEHCRTIKLFIGVCRWFTNTNIYDLLYHVSNLTTSVVCFYNESWARPKHCFVIFYESVEAMLEHAYAQRIRCNSFSYCFVWARGSDSCWTFFSASVWSYCQNTDTYNGFRNAHALLCFLEAVQAMVYITSVASVRNLIFLKLAWRGGLR